MTQKYYSAEKSVQIVISLLKAYGIRRIIASPGTTNLTFVASLQHDSFFEIYSAPEERSAAYMAVGMAEESGEPVVITCTGATASRNYLPGLTEAFYRKLPILAVTATQSRSLVGQLVPQVIDRSVIPKDAAKHSVHIPIVKDRADYNSVVLKVNEAFHYATKLGGGPVHINLETAYDSDFSIKELPQVTRVEYYRIFDPMPEIPIGSVGIFVGSHRAMDLELTDAIDSFCEKYKAVVFCDHTSNYKGKFRFQYPLVLSQDNFRPDFGYVSTLIHIGEVSGAYAEPRGKQIWRVNQDGLIRSAYGLPKAVFEMREIDFFRRYSNVDDNVERPQYLEECREMYDSLYAEIPSTLPFSNIWIAQFVSKMIPEKAVVHFGILNSLRSWNFFELPTGVNSYSNVGGFGIDGAISTVIGGAIASPDRLHFLIVGDLAFFYDLNSLGNRHLPSNLRILLINNGRGTEFTNYNHPASRFGDEADMFLAAAGHYGHQSDMLVKHYAEDIGFKYLSGSNKDDVGRHAKEFVDPRINIAPILFEVFTDSKCETEALHIVRNLRTEYSSMISNAIRKTVGRKGINTIKNILGK